MDFIATAKHCRLILQINIRTDNNIFYGIEAHTYFEYGKKMIIIMWIYCLYIMRPCLKHANTTKYQPM